MPKRNLNEEVGKAVQVSVPEGLSGRILAHQSQYVRRQRLWAYLVLVGLTATIVWQYTQPSMGTGGPQGDLGQEVVEHIRAEPLALRSRTPLHEGSVLSVLRAIGMNTTASLGPVTFAQRCAFRARAIGHLVLRGTDEPLTLLILPHEALDGHRTFEVGDLRGVLVASRNGSLALVGRSRQDLLPLAQELLNTTGW